MNANDPIEIQRDGEGFIITARGLDFGTYEVANIEALQQFIRDHFPITKPE